MHHVSWSSLATPRGYPSNLMWCGRKCWLCDTSIPSYTCEQVTKKILPCWTPGHFHFPSVPSGMERLATEQPGYLLQKTYTYTIVDLEGFLSATGLWNEVLSMASQLACVYITFNICVTSSCEVCHRGLWWWWGDDCGQPWRKQNTNLELWSNVVVVLLWI